MTGSGVQLAAEPLPLLSCRNIAKYFGALAAVKDLSFDVNQGDIVGIGGPNGAGKTTVFELVSGFNPTDGGNISLGGERIDRLAPHVVCHRGIARMFQSNTGFDTLTARQNVLLAASHGETARAFPPLVFHREVRDRADAAMAFVGYRRSPDSIVRNLPVLDRKLLMVASAIATKPRLLLMDEPVGGLNPEEIDQFIDLVRKLVADGVTIMLIEHVMRFLVQLSTKVIIMHHGGKIFEGAPNRLVEDPTVREVYLGEHMSRRMAGYSQEVA